MPSEKQIQAAAKATETLALERGFSPLDEAASVSLTAAARVRAEDNAEGGEVLWCETCGERAQEVSTEHAGLCLECWISEGRPE